MFRENVNKLCCLLTACHLKVMMSCMSSFKKKESQATSPQLECESYLLGASETTGTLAFSRECCLPFDVSGTFGSPPPLSLSLFDSDVAEAGLHGLPILLPEPPAGEHCHTQLRWSILKLLVNINIHDISGCLWVSPELLSAQGLCYNASGNFVSLPKFLVFLALGLISELP